MKHYKVHGFLDGKMIFNRYMSHIPNNGDTMRFGEEKYGVIKDVIWAMDEDTISDTQRINLRIESI